MNTIQPINTTQDITWHYVIDIHGPDDPWYTIILEMI